MGWGGRRVGWELQGHSLKMENYRKNTQDQDGKQSAKASSLKDHMRLNKIPGAEERWEVGKWRQLF